MRVAGAEYDSCLVRCDNLNLKQRILELESKSTCRHHMTQTCCSRRCDSCRCNTRRVQQQLQHVIQQCNTVAASSDGALVVGPGGMLTPPAPLATWQSTREENHCKVLLTADSRAAASTGSWWQGIKQCLARMIPPARQLLVPW